MFSLFVREKPYAILMALKIPDTNWHLSKLAKNTNTTYVFVTHFITKLEKAGIVKTEVVGKKRVVRLTEKGMGIAAHIESLKDKFTY